MFKPTFESDLVGVIFSTASGEILDANDYFLDLVGYTREELIQGSINWMQLTPEEYRPDSEQRTRKLIAGIGIVPFQKEYVRRDGTRIPVFISGAKVDDGKFLTLIVDQRLNHGKKAPEYPHHQFNQGQFVETFIEHLPNMVFVKEAKELRIVYLNRAGENLLGVNRKELLGKNVFDFMPPQQAATFDANDRATLASKKKFDIAEESLVTKTGSRWIRTTLIPILDAKGDPIYLLGAVEDITDRKIADEQRVRLAYEQATREEAQKLSERLAILSEKSRDASRAKSEFLANMSHEIRTPLTAMLGFADLLRNETLSDYQKNCLSRITRNGKQLLSIIDEILDLGKVETKTFTIYDRAFELPELIQELEETFRFQSEEKQLKYTITSDDRIPKSISADPNRLRQILLNIIGNAIKFTAAGSVEVRFEIQHLEKQNRALLHVTVKDTGIGISNNEIGFLFQPFTQADSSLRRRFGGNGLGLHISRRLARLMGGDVVLRQSQPNTGSEFVVTIEIGLTPACSPNSKTPAQVSHRTKTGSVLIVDDSIDNRELFKYLLRSYGIHADTAAGGAKALQKITQKPYDLILLDIQMPQMDGFETLQKLRHAHFAGTIVALTAHSMKGDRERFISAGFDDYLGKPIDESLLKTCLNRYLHGFQNLTADPG